MTSRMANDAPEGPKGRAPAALDETTTAAGKFARIQTVSHTLETEVAERLRLFAFKQRVSESAVLEFALLQFFSAGEDRELGTQLRAAGASLRRRAVEAPVGGRSRRELALAPAAGAFAPKQVAQDHVVFALSEERGQRVLDDGAFADPLEEREFLEAFREGDAEGMGDL